SDDQDHVLDRSARDRTAIIVGYMLRCLRACGRTRCHKSRLSWPYVDLVTESGVLSVHLSLHDWRPYLARHQRTHGSCRHPSSSPQRLHLNYSLLLSKAEMASYWRSLPMKCCGDPHAMVTPILLVD